MVSVSRIHTFAMDPDDLEELITRRATLIAAGTHCLLRTDRHPAAAQRRRNLHRRLAVGSMDVLVAAFPAAASAVAESAMKLTREATATKAKLVDQR
jgi:hypothetical protein